MNRQHMVAFKDAILAYALYYPAVGVAELGGDCAGDLAGRVWGAARMRSRSGVLVAFIQYSQRFFRPIQDLSEKYNILQAAMAASERVFKLLDTPAELQSPAEPRALRRFRPDRVSPCVVHLSKRMDDGACEQRGAEQIAAETQDVEWILKDVSFVIEPDQTAAIVGHTGAGKTTIIGLMMRFYEIQRGSVLINGVDVREQDVPELRRHFGVVLQDPFLFTGTIAEQHSPGFGVDHGRADEGRGGRGERGRLYSRAAQGFDEPLRERGSTLSTGQKQLINFARALAHDPRILVLDEATSSVDTDTEMRVRSALERMVPGRTSVMVAHRLSTVQQADRILVMHKGQLREMGTHQELLAQRGFTGSFTAAVQGSGDSRRGHSLRRSARCTRRLTHLFSPPVVVFWHL